MKKLRIGIIEIQGRRPARAVWQRIMRANIASIMPQALAVWCEEQGHDVFLTNYSGYQNMLDPLPDDLDLVFFSSFTFSAQIAYALSNFFRSKGAITALGGPHARSYPEDAVKYFDYVFGLTNKEIVRDVLQGLEQHRPVGVSVSATRQPPHLPGVRERWKFIEPLLKHAPWLKMVGMMGSFGCPYTCSFCIDSTVPYQILDVQELQEDLRFLANQEKPPIVAWHDPNFGVRFKLFLDAIEEAVPSGHLQFMAESTLSLLKEDNVKRLKKNGFQAVLPGIESWYDLGNKTRTRKTGMEKVHAVSSQTNMILSHLPYLQGNFVLGLDSDEGAEPFELTKRYLDLSPGTFPGFSMLTAYGRNTPLNLEYQRQNRVLPVPFHFLNGAMLNMKPKNYGWLEIYDRWIDVREYAFSPQMIYKRMKSANGLAPKAMHIIRSMSSEAWGRTNHLKETRRRLAHDKPFRAFFEQETIELPQYFIDYIKKDLGPLWHWLPESALSHDTHAYLKSTHPSSSQSKA